MPSTGGCKNSFHPQKAPKCVFDKYSINAGKKQSAVISFLLNANKRPETALRTEFWQNRDTHCPVADPRHPVRCKNFLRIYVAEAVKYIHTD